MILRFLSSTDSNFKSAASRKLRSQGLSLWNSPIPVEHRWAGISCRWNPGGWGTCRLCFSAQPSQLLFWREHWSLSMDHFCLSPVGWGRKYRFAMGSSGLKEGSAVVREWAGNGQQGSGWQRWWRRVEAAWGGEAKLGSLGGEAKLDSLGGEAKLGSLGQRRRLWSSRQWPLDFVGRYHFLLWPLCQNFLPTLSLNVKCKIREQDWSRGYAGPACFLFFPDPLTFSFFLRQIKVGTVKS